MEKFRGPPALAQTGGDLLASGAPRRPGRRRSPRPAGAASSGSPGRSGSRSPRARWPAASIPIPSAITSISRLWERSMMARAIRACALRAVDAVDERLRDLPASRTGSASGIAAMSSRCRSRRPLAAPPASGASSRSVLLLLTSIRTDSVISRVRRPGSSPVASRILGDAPGTRLALPQLRARDVDVQAEPAVGRPPTRPPAGRPPRAPSGRGHGSGRSPRRSG